MTLSKKKEVRSHPRRDLLQSAMEMCNARVYIWRIKGKEKLCIISVQVVI